jgi:hypothetical protein
MSSGNFLGDKEPPERKAHNLTAISESIVYTNAGASKPHTPSGRHGLPACPSYVILYETTATWHGIGHAPISHTYQLVDRLCGLVVRVLGYRSGGPGSIPGTTRKKK